MKTVILFTLLLGTAVSQAAFLPANCEDLAAQVKAVVISREDVSEDNNQVECTFKVSVDYAETEIDQVCGLDPSEVELATFVDPSCKIQAGDQFNHTTNQYFSTKDMSSRGLFYWISLGGYLSHNVFPNYGK